MANPSNLMAVFALAVHIKMGLGALVDGRGASQYFKRPLNGAHPTYYYMSLFDAHLSQLVPYG